jgi:hypothetical protein
VGDLKNSLSERIRMAKQAIRSLFFLCYTTPQHYQHRSNMGRVRRYKKLKACDPCASGRGATQREEDAKYDMAPSGLDSDEERCTYGARDRDGDRKGTGARRGRRRRGWVACLAA